jgi:proton glutamate symport protein
MKLKLHWQILIALVLGLGAGWWAGEDGAFLGLRFYAVFDFVGTLFINALKMIIVPLIVSSIIVGIAGIGSSGNLGRLGGKTLLFYGVTTTMAILVGLILVNLFQPGIVNGVPAGDLLALTAGAEDVAARVGDRDASDVVEIFLRMVPPNIVQAAANGQMLGLIFFSLLFGFFMTKVANELAETMLRFWQGVFQVMMKITEWVMSFAPIGVFALVARVVATTGFEAAGPLLVFALTVLLALIIHTVVTLPALLALVGRMNPWPMFPAMAPAMMTAFSTASSSATLPIRWTVWSAEPAFPTALPVSFCRWVPRAIWTAPRCTSVWRRFLLPRLTG